MITSWSGLVISEGARLPLVLPYGAPLFLVTPTTKSQRGTIAFDQIKSRNRQGTGSSFQMFGSGSTTAGHVPVYDLNGNLIDSGAVPSTGGITQLTGDVTAGPGSSSQVATIQPQSVTLAKIQNAVGNAKLLGSGVSGSGASYSEISLGTNISMSGTTLNVTGTTYGPIASLPGAVPAAGSVYVCSDCGYTFVSDGTNWNARYLGYPVVRPIAANFSWVAQGSATASSTTGPLVIYGPPTSADVLSSQVVTPPSTPYTYTIGFVPQIFLANYYQVGFMLRNSSTGKCLTIGYLANATGPYANVQVNRYTQPNSGSATFSAQIFNQPLNQQTPVWFRVHNDGTNITFFVGTSPNDFTPNTLFTEALSSWVSSVNQVGVFVDVNNSANFSIMNLFHFVQT